MIRSFQWAAAAALAVALGACTEQLKGGKACPSLCPEQALGFKDTTFLAADVIDTAVTLPGVPSIGTENQLLVARYAQTGDSVVTVAVFRFDTLPHGLPQADTSLPDVPLAVLDSAGLFITLLAPPTQLDTVFVEDTITLQLFDVYVNAPDLDTSLVHAKFSGVPVGTRTLPRDSVSGVIRIPLDSAYINATVLSGTRVRLGLQVVSKGNARVTLVAREGSVSGLGTASLQYFGRTDTSTKKTYFVASPISHSSAFGPAISALADFQMVFQGSNAVAPGLLGMGGLPSNRILIRFKFPAWLVDSSTTVVRADLLLHQVPFLQFRADSDSVGLVPQIVFAGPEVTDLARIGVLSGIATLVPLRPDTLPPAGAGLDTLGLVRTGANVFNFWKSQGKKVQRGIVFELANEGIEPRQLVFYGPSAALALQPKVHVSYVPHAVIGLP